MLLRSLIVEREPIYRQQETVHGFASGMFGIDAEQMSTSATTARPRPGPALRCRPRGAADRDRAGRRADASAALRASCTTTPPPSASAASTAPPPAARIRGRDAPRPSPTGIPRTTARSEAAAVHPDHDRRRRRSRRVPLRRRQHQRLAHPHRDLEHAARAWPAAPTSSTWPTRKLCSRENMDHIDRAGGRFVTVMPRIAPGGRGVPQMDPDPHPDWELVWDRPNPRHATARATAGTSTAPRCRLRGLARRVGLEHAADAAPGRAPARATSAAADRATSEHCASAWPAPRRGCAAPPRSTCR